MLVKHTPGKWRQYRWKVLKPYSTQSESPQLQQNVIVSTNIAITEHAKGGRLDIARYLFDQMPQRTVVSWNTMISGYSRWGRFEDSLSLLSLMHKTNIKLNETTFSTILSVFAHAQELCVGKQVHCLVLNYGCLRFNLVGSALLYFYANCSRITDAKNVFDELRDGNELLWSLMVVGYVQTGLLNDGYDLFVQMPKKDVVSWTTLISEFAKSDDCCGRALELFEWMMKSGEVVPNEYTFDCVVRVCGKLGALSEGMIVHGLVIKYGHERDQSVCGALIELYCGCEAVDEAKRVYYGANYPCLSAINALIHGLILLSRIEEAEQVFCQLRDKNPVSYNLMVKGFAMSGRVEDSKALFDEMPHKSISSVNTMISVYSRNGEIDKALALFEVTKGEKNPVTWNAMMSGYSQANMHEEALQLYVAMRRLLIECTRSTFSVLLHACSCIGSLQQGQMLHANLIKTPFESNVYVGTSLVHMYSKCGSIVDAQKSFSSIYSPNVAAWTALINAYAHHGLGYEAILLFEHMLEHKVAPNGATFVGVLMACGRTGLVNEGMGFFHSMEKHYGVTPSLEHYACVVDLLGRSGRLQEAENFIKAMPIEADCVIWAALLSASWFWMNKEVGERAAKEMLKLDPKQTSAYIILSNMYAVLGKWGDKMKVRNKLKGLEVKKDPGCSWIELSSRLHVFSAEDRTHQQCTLIYASLKHLTANMMTIVPFTFNVNEFLSTT